MVILAAGLTPAWQQILVFERFSPGEVNRATQAVWCASGKVLNVGCALHHLRGNVTAAMLGGCVGVVDHDGAGANLLEGHLGLQPVRQVNDVAAVPGSVLALDGQFVRHGPA